MGINNVSYLCYIVFETAHCKIFETFEIRSGARRSIYI